MRSPKPKKRKAWLITWESGRDDYFRDLDRPRVVTLLEPRVSSRTIEIILPALFISEKQLTLGEKLSVGLFPQSPSFLREELGGYCCGSNPWLYARPVYDLYVEHYPNTDYHQTLHWIEYPRYAYRSGSSRPVEVSPAQPDSEDVHFDVLWYGKSFLDEDRQA